MDHEQPAKLLPCRPSVHSALARRSRLSREELSAAIKSYINLNITTKLATGPLSFGYPPSLTSLTSCRESAAASPKDGGLRSTPAARVRTATTPIHTAATATTVTAPSIAPNASTSPPPDAFCGARDLSALSSR